MYKQINKTEKGKSQSVASSLAQKKGKFNQSYSFVDNRSEAVTQRKLQAMVNNSPVQRKTVINNLGQPCKFGPADNSKNVVVGHTMNAWLDPKNPLRGQAANVNASQDGLMAWIKKIYPLAEGVKSVKGHLLNDNLGGTALDNNLYPLSKGANGIHLSTAENYVKKAVWNKGRAVKYSVVVAGSNDYTGADSTNAKATFRTSVSPWEDVNDTSKVGATEYTANIVSNLGSPKTREAQDKDGKNSESITGIKGLKPSTKPASTVGGLSSEEQGLRNSQPGTSNIEAKGSEVNYSSSFATASGAAPGDDVIMAKAKTMLDNTPIEFIDEYINDSTRFLIDNLIIKNSDLSEAQRRADKKGVISELVNGLPGFVADVATKKYDLWIQIQDALNLFIQEEFESYHEDDIQNDN